MRSGTYLDLRLQDGQIERGGALDILLSALEETRKQVEGKTYVYEARMGMDGKQIHIYCREKIEAANTSEPVSETKEINMIVANVEAMRAAALNMPPGTYATFTIAEGSVDGSLSGNFGEFLRTLEAQREPIEGKTVVYDGRTSMDGRQISLYCTAR